MKNSSLDVSATMPSAIFPADSWTIEGSTGDAKKHLQDLPGMTDRRNLLPTGGVRHVAAARGHEAPAEEFRPLTLDSADRHKDVNENYRELSEADSIVSGTPKTVLPRIRRVLETIRPGSIFFWDGDGSMTHEDSMRSLRLFGEEVLPAVREMGKELGLTGPYEVDPATNLPVLSAT